MPLGEFELIQRFFASAGACRDDVVLGVGDDAALVVPPPGVEIALAADAILEGVHFPAGLDAEAIGHRVLAVNLSDLAAMGAEPAWALLSLTLPRSDSAWLEGFTRGLDALARRSGIALVGGDTTSGPLAAVVSVAGLVPRGQALRRSGARPGDWIYVSGAPGEAAAGLAVLQGSLPRPAAAERLVSRFRLPEPRLALGNALRGVASACIDVSDGLAADLGKLCAASGVGARLEVASLPVSAALVEVAGADATRLCLAGGDDYELLFAVPGDRVGDLPELGVTLTRIGRVVAGAGVEIVGEVRGEGPLGGYDHFLKEGRTTTARGLGGPSQ